MTTEDAKPKYTMRLDMRVLQHLGIRLYSNVAAVISELVANSWDAEATQVEIKFDADNDQVVITDNGNGMTELQINQRFLTVGYEKRKSEGGTSPRFKRDFMGRKGIGKLSVLSIAEVVDVHSCCDGQKNALQIRVEDLEKAISDNVDYNPKEILFDQSICKTGTTLVLSKLVKKRSAITVAALRKRLARRFSIIGHSGSLAGDTFNVSINGKPVDHNDRDDLRALEYVWEFGKETIPKAAMPHLHERFLIANNKIRSHAGWMIKGWFGTARKPAELDQDDAGSMKNIVVLARGRLIQESILDKLGFNRIFGSYVTGLIEADFLDTEDQDDIATSDRQRLIEDDPRVKALQEFMREALLTASDTWSTKRRTKKATDSKIEYPALKKWVDELPEGQRAAANSMLGLIGELQLEADKEDDRKNLYRSGVLAFERLRLKEAAHNLERLESLDATQLLPLLIAQDHYESALYADIVRTRIEAIKQFQHLTNVKAKETVLQKHLFDNLWLLDPGWERVESSKTIEQRLQRDFPKDFAEALTKDEKLGRIDIKYRKNSGVHIIVELKKYERPVKIDDLKIQGRKYKAAMHKLATQDGETNPRIELVFVLGQPVKVDNDAGLPHDYVAQELNVINGRVAFYDELIKNALTEYEEFLTANGKSDRIEKVLNGISGASGSIASSPMAAPARQKPLPVKNVPAKKTARKKVKKNRRGK